MNIKSNFQQLLKIKFTYFNLQLHTIYPKLITFMHIFTSHHVDIDLFTKNDEMKPFMEVESKLRGSVVKNKKLCQRRIQ